MVACGVGVVDVDRDGALDVLDSSRGPAQIAWWEVLSFEPAGSLESSVLDLGEPQGALLSFDATVPFGSTLVLDIRFGDDPADLGDWLTVPDDGVVSAHVARYAQYRVSMTTGDPTTGPVLREVSLAW